MANSQENQDKIGTKQVYLDVLREYNKSLNIVSSILENVDTIVRSSARVEINRLINNWNDYCHATHAYLEAINNDGGIQPEEYMSIFDLHKDNKVIFDKAYEAMDKILDKRSKVLKEERHRKMRKKLQEKSCVHHINWLIDYSSHVLTPRTALSAAQVLDVSNNCNTRLALAKEDEKPTRGVPIIFNLDEFNRKFTPVFCDDAFLHVDFFGCGVRFCMAIKVFFYYFGPELCHRLTSKHCILPK
jgi:hypothetical protein